jgi:hypothetical protein
MKRVICWVFGHLAEYHPGGGGRTLETCERCGRQRFVTGVRWPSFRPRGEPKP